MRITCISDTHGQHESLSLPDGDVLIHAGDFSRGHGSLDEVSALSEWFKRQPHRHKILVPGNHDFVFQNHEAEARNLMTGATVLMDERVDIDGVRFWGSPWQPWFHDWAFNYPLTEDSTHWDKMPLDIDVSITHGPPKGFGDEVVRGPNVGSLGLLQRLMKSEAALHVCGHIHEGYGLRSWDGLLFANAAVLDEKYRHVNAPLTIDLTFNRVVP